MLNKSRRVTEAGNVAYIPEERNAYNVFVWKCEGKRPFGKCSYRWNDNIKMNLK
jgi:hypothetical protein